MSPSKHLGQLLLMGVPGSELDPETAARLKKLQPGGFILFGRNIQSPAQLRKLIDDLRDLSEIEPFITIDQEGGRVSRLRLIGEEPPNAQALRDKGDPELIKRHGRLTGQVLRQFGFNLDLCPVLDISYDDAADNSLKGRTYGRDPQQVITNAGIFNRAMRAEGILSCGKHFPGYGPAECDPHEFLPVITKSREEMEKSELMPYSALLPELDSVMTCHSNYTAYDPDRGRSFDGRNRPNVRQLPVIEDYDVIPTRKIIRQLRRQGYGQVQEIALRGDTYRILAVRNNGAMVKLRLDAFTGEILTVKRVGWVSAPVREVPRRHVEPGVTIEFGWGNRY